MHPLASSCPAISCSTSSSFSFSPVSHTNTHTNTHRVIRVELLNGQRISVQPFPFSHTGVGQFPAIKQLPILPAASPLTGCCSSQGVAPQLVCILCQAGLGCSLLCCNELVCASLCCTVRYNTRFRIWCCVCVCVCVCVWVCVCVGVC